MAADMEAARWFVLLSETPDDANLVARFETWHRTSALNRDAWRETRRLMDGLRAAGPADAALPASRLMDENVDRRAKLGVRRAVATVAAVAFAACLAVFVLPGIMLRLVADYTTGTAELRAVTLPDGSTVRLAPESAIALAFRPERREVELMRGEALFAVVPDAARPFRVAAGEVRATVLGTEFAVRRRGGASEVAVKHGSVQVDRRDGTPIASRLRAGQWVALAADGALQSGEVAPEQIAAWGSHQLVVLDRRLQDVIADLAPYHNGIVVVLDGDLRQRRLTGVFNLDNVGHTLDSVASALGARAQRPVPGLTIIAAP